MRHHFLLIISLIGIAAQGLKSEDLQDDLAHDTSAVKNLERHSSSVNESLKEMLKVINYEGINRNCITYISRSVGPVVASSPAYREVRGSNPTLA